MHAYKDWQSLRLGIARFIIRFGTPGLIALKRVMPRIVRDLALQLLRALEAAARRLLVEDALKAPRENAIFRPTRFPSPSYRCGRPGFASDNSADWGVTFRLTPSARRRAAPKPRVRAAIFPSPTVGACALAERLEALMRVASDPARWARRLALRWRAKPERALGCARRMLGLETLTIEPPRLRAFRSSA
jgi:hypothetical protein